MNCNVQNLTRRLVSIHCNSGATYHLPPGYVYELPEQEIIRNSSVAKLVERKLIAIREVEKNAKPKQTIKDTGAGSETKESDKDTGSTSKKKTQPSK